METVLEKLNDQQREAVETTEGPLLVLAGAGSGKTRVLTSRIAYIIHKKLASPSNILSVTFTNKAAAEMKERIALLIGGANLSWCSTFHSMCVRILRSESEKIGISSAFSIYDSGDSLDTIKQAMVLNGINIKDFNPYAVRSVISNAKNDLISSADFSSVAESFFEKTVARIYVEYQKILNENQALDFDDLIMKTVRLFENNHDVLARYQNLFKYIHIDEYQDTNYAQYALIKLLTAKNICVVGDEDQSIYKFRGANIKNILNFEKDFQDTRIIKLERNYRSTQTILDASFSIVKENKERKDKKLWTENNSGEKIQVYTAKDEADEAEWVGERAIDLKSDGREYEDMAVLYRTNAQSRALEESFIRKNIPYIVVGGTEFYNRKEIKDILAYLRILYNRSDSLSLRRIINTPRRGIGKVTFDSLEKTAKSLNKSSIEFLLEDSSDINNTKLKKFSKLVVDFNDKLQSLKLSELMKYILEKSNYLTYLDDGTYESQGRIENLEELISVASQYDEMESEEALKSFLESIALLENQSNKKKKDREGVKLMTIHASKGLEFENVFIVGMEESIFPHSRSYSDMKEMEEERRLAYVAITRAKSNLYLSHAENRTFFGRLQNNPPSRFLESIPDKYIEYVVSDGVQKVDSFFDSDLESGEFCNPEDLADGEWVLHDMFGKGRIVNLKDTSIIIDFGGDKGRKELSLKYAVLQRVEEG